MSTTSDQYDIIINKCRDIFMKKMSDYGTSWRILRPTSLTDQIFIKGQRIRTIEEKGSQRVNEQVDNEYIGIINYSIMAIIQLNLGTSTETLQEKEAERLYNKYFNEAKALMEKKNHDYGEAWKDMRISSITDLILMKILRIKQIEDHDGKTIISEGIDANYLDMINYAVFALFKLQSTKSETRSQLL